MNLTIEKAKEIYKWIKHLEIVFDDEKLQSRESISAMQFKQAKGFIEGWNQAIDEIVSRFDKKPIIYSSEAMLLKEIKELKIKEE